MKKKTATKRRIHSTRRKSQKKLHHRVISFFRGDGGIYVIFVLASVMAGAFALTGGVIPTLDPKPSAANQVTIDPDSAKQSSESALQLVDIKIKPTATPTPTPSLVPTTTGPITPSPTTITSCLERTVITMLIDLSASMGNDGKILELNEALGDFISTLPAKTIVGGIAFGSSSFSTDGIDGVSNLSGYTSNKSLLEERYAHLVPGPTGGTYMRNGFQAALNRLTTYQNANATKNYRYVSIVFSDGVPEVSGLFGSACLQGGAVDGVCWAKIQDPRGQSFSGLSTNLQDALEKKVSKSYSVAIYDSRTGERGAGLTKDLTTLMQTISTTTGKPYYQAVDLKNGPVDKSLRGFFTAIYNDSCSQ